MLADKAINLMLNTYKGLNWIKIKTPTNQTVGQSNIAWGTPSNKTIKTLPFTVMASKGLGTTVLDTFDITGTVPIASTKQSVLGQQPDPQFDYFNRLSKAYQQSLQSDYPIINGTKFGNNVYNFILFRTNISSPLPGINNDNLTGTYNATGPEINESLYEFVDSRVNTEQETFHTIRVSISSGGGGGTYYYLLIAMRDKYETSGSSTMLKYKLQDFGYNDTIDVDTLIKVPSGISEGMVKI